MWQINIMAHIIAKAVSLCVLINRSHKETGAIKVFITGCLTQGELIWVKFFQEGRPNHRFAVDSFMGNAIGIGHQHRLHLEISTIDAGSRLSKSMRVLGIAAPPVHIELHWSESLPLKLAHIDRHTLATEDAVHVACYVGLAGKT